MELFELSIELFFFLNRFKAVLLKKPPVKLNVQ